ncbi:MAG: cytochrome c-type biogenesis protein [Pseudomonadota bacterium]
MRVFLIILLLVSPAVAANPWEQLDDPALEARARALSKELRCLVCQNQSIDESDAEVAKDLRLLVRERLVAGDSHEEVLAYLTDRYGAFVRLRPPLTASTLILWIAPAIVVLFALAGAIVYLRGRQMAPTEPQQLSPEEEEKLQQILSGRSEG